MFHSTWRKCFSLYPQHIPDPHNHISPALSQFEFGFISVSSWQRPPVSAPVSSLTQLRKSKCTWIAIIAIFHCTGLLWAWAVLGTLHVGKTDTSWLLLIPFQRHGVITEGQQGSSMCIAWTHQHRNLVAEQNIPVMLGWMFWAPRSCHFSLYLPSCY